MAEPLGCAINGCVGVGRQECSISGLLNRRMNGAAHSSLIWYGADKKAWRFTVFIPRVHISLYHVAQLRVDPAGVERNFCRSER